mgnify:CR=1 FL=1
MIDDGGEALSPLLANKVLQLQAHALANGAGALLAAGGTGSVGGTPQPLGSAAPTHALRAPAARPAANGVCKQRSQAAAGPAGSQGLTSRLDLSTMAVDLAPLDGPAPTPAAAAAAVAGAAAPAPSASFQPSSLPPPGVVAAALAALEQQQAALNGGLFTPAPLVEQLGEVYHALQQQVGSSVTSGQAERGAAVGAAAAHSGLWLREAGWGSTTHCLCCC